MSDRIFSIGPQAYLDAEKALQREFAQEPEIFSRILKTVEPFKWWWI